MYVCVCVCVCVYSIEGLSVFRVRLQEADYTVITSVDPTLQLLSYSTHFY